MASHTAILYQVTENSLLSAPLPDHFEFDLYHLYTASYHGSDKRSDSSCPPSCHKGLCQSSSTRCEGCDHKFCALPKCLVNVLSTVAIDGEIRCEFQTRSLHIAARKRAVRVITKIQEESDKELYKADVVMLLIGLLCILFNLSVGIADMVLDQWSFPLVWYALSLLVWSVFTGVWGCIWRKTLPDSIVFRVCMNYLGELILLAQFSWLGFKWNVLDSWSQIEVLHIVSFCCTLVAIGFFLGYRFYLINHYRQWLGPIYKHLILSSVPTLLQCAAIAYGMLFLSQQTALICFAILLPLLPSCNAFSVLVSNWYEITVQCFLVCALTDPRQKCSILALMKEDNSLRKVHSFHKNLFALTIPVFGIFTYFWSLLQCVLLIVAGMFTVLLNDNPQAVIISLCVLSVILLLNLVSTLCNYKFTALVIVIHFFALFALFALFVLACFFALLLLIASLRRLASSSSSDQSQQRTTPVVTTYYY